MTAFALCAGLATTVGAQGQATTSASVPEVKLPPSPPGQAAVQVGGTWTKTDQGQRYQGGKWIVVDYSRPLLRGRRNIFGSGAEYGKVVSDGSPVWRAGANATTTLTTQVPLSVGGKTLQPGVYNVFVDLKEGNWSLVLSNQERQPKYDPNDKVKLYGSYNYDPKFDVARVVMSVAERADPGRAEHPVEQFTISFLTVSPKMLMLRMEWGTTVATAPIELVQ
jgi:hypothetical protein